MPLNTDDDTPEQHTGRPRKTANKQKSKNTSHQAKQVSATCSTPENDSDSAVEEDENGVMARIAKAKGTRLIRDLVAEVGINWETPWMEISAVKKVKLYQAAHEEAPFLKKFVNDWPTQALAMQLLKNRQGHSYCHGYLEVPDKYAYLKDNAAKKKKKLEALADHSAGVMPPLGKEEEGMNEDGDVSTDTPIATLGPAGPASGLKSKRMAPVLVAAQPRKKQKKVDTTKTGTCSTAKGKGRKKPSFVESEGEEEIQESNEVNPEVQFNKVLACGFEFSRYRVTDGLAITVDPESYYRLWVKISQKVLIFIQ
ncbi:hypothetical protein EI94DRAFT_1704735 [Lactarius quietus]|nr:hypothetical protein EI94DRAFT_1704735 [Lactarius quietus]